MNDVRTGLSCLLCLLAVLFAILASVAVGMFFGAGFGVLAASVFTAAAILLVANEFAKTMG